MAEPTRIAFVLPGLGSGGLERVVTDLALALPARGYEPGVFCTSKVGVHAGELRHAGIPVWNCRDGPFRVPGLPARLAARLAAFRPALVHAHGGAWRPAAVACALLRVPALVFTEHGRDARQPRWRTAVDRWCSRRTDRVTAVSAAAARQLQHLLALEAPPDVIRNGIEAAPAPRRSREEVRGELGLGADVLALCVGRLEPIKNHALLIDALPLVRGTRPAVTVALLGSGSLEQELRARAARLGLQRSVLFLGHRQDVADWLGAADLFVLPSTTARGPALTVRGTLRDPAAIAPGSRAARWSACAPAPSRRSGRRSIR